MHISRLARRAMVTALATFALLAVAGPAMAGSYPGGSETPPAVGGEKFFHGGTGGLTKTGADVLLFILIAVAALVAGLLIRKLSRRPARSDD